MNKTPADSNQFFFRNIKNPKTMTKPLALTTTFNF